MSVFDVVAKMTQYAEEKCLTVDWGWGNVGTANPEVLLYVLNVKRSMWEHVVYREIIHCVIGTGCNVSAVHYSGGGQYGLCKLRRNDESDAAEK